MDGGSPWWQDEHLGEMRRAAGAVNTIPAAKPRSVVMSGVRSAVMPEVRSVVISEVRSVVTERMTRH